MSNLHPSGDYSVDRREEVRTNQQPGYVASEHVATDVAAERRQGANQINGLLFTLLGVLEMLLGFRFVLQLMAANPNSGFAQLVFGLSDIFVAPFAGLVRNPTANGMVLEVTTLIAMAVYALIFWVVFRLVAVGADAPSARTVSRTISEAPPPAAGQTVTRTVNEVPGATTGVQTERTSTTIR